MIDAAADRKPSGGGLVTWPGTCHWGDGALHRARQALGSRLDRPLVITDAGVWPAVGDSVRRAFADAAAPLLDGTLADGALFDEVVPNPSLAEARAALRQARRRHCTAVVAVGGGSVIDVAKLVYAGLASGLDVDALREAPGQAWLDSAATAADPPFLAVPTTAGTGSESSSAALLQHDDGRKRLYRSIRFRPSQVALVPELTLGLPPRPTAHSGFDALLHAVGAWVNADPSPVGKAIALHAARLCLTALPAVLERPASLAARTDMQMGAYLAGVAIGMSKVDAVHGLCTPLESRLHLAHAEVLAPVFSPVARFTVRTDPAAYAAAARSLGLCRDADDGAAALALIERVEGLAAMAGIATRFTDLVLTPEDAGLLADQALQSASTALNPRPLGRPDIQSLYLQMAASQTRS